MVEARDATRNPTSLRALPPSSRPTQRHGKEVSSPVSGAGVEKPCLRIRAGKKLTTESEMQDQRQKVVPFPHQQSWALPTHRESFSAFQFIMVFGFILIKALDPQRHMGIDYVSDTALGF